MSEIVFLHQSSSLESDQMFKEHFYLFETMLLTPLGIQNLSLHLDRLYQSLNSLNISPPLNKNELSLLLHPLKSDSSSRLRLNVTTKNIWFNITPLSIYNEIQLLKIATLCLVDSKNHLFNHKSTFYDFIREEKKKYTDIDDIILFNEKEEITETTRANIYLISFEEKTIFTPPLSSGVLPGINRQILLGKNEYLLNEIPFKIKERIIKKNEIHQNSKILLSNSLMGIKHARIL